MGRVKSSKNKHHYAGLGKKTKTKNRIPDIDQLWEESQPEKLEKNLKERTKLNEDLPGLGQFYCIACGRYFINKEVLAEHFKSKLHKRR